MGDLELGRVYLHLDASGAYLGNGGFLALNLLGEALWDLGYDVRVFDVQDRLTVEDFDWLALIQAPFVARWADVRSDDAPILTSWLRGWLPTLEEEPVLWSRLRYWCHDELLRTDSDPARAFVRAHLPGFYVTNGHLRPWYRELGLDVGGVLPLWVRWLFRPDEGARVLGRIGYQPDRGGDERLDALQARFGDERVVACEGEQRRVAELMRTCDVYVWWNNPKNLVCRGEGFGLSLYEALASGCVPVARRHAGNRHLEGFPLLDTWEQALSLTEMLLQDAEGRECFRAAARDVAQATRWGAAHTAAAHAWIEGRRLLD